MANVGVFGIGSIGSILGRYLKCDSSNSIYFYNRSHKTDITIFQEEHKEVINLTIDGLNNYNVRLEWLIICIKEYDEEQALKNIKRLVHPGLKIALFRNGLDLKARYTQIVEHTHVLETIIDCPVQRNNIGEYIQYYIPKITLPISHLSDSFEKLFSETPLSISKTKDFKTEIWKKLIESSSIGTLQVLARKPCGVFKDPNIINLFNCLISEAIIVARHDGSQIEEEFHVNLLKKVKSYPDMKASSMLSDFLHGRRLELEAKIGAIVKMSRKYKVSSYLTKNLYNLIKQLDMPENES